MKKIFSVFLALALCFALTPFSVGAGVKSIDDGITDSGDCGDAVYWCFYAESGILSIDGLGEMYDYPDGTPWESYNAEIKAVHIFDAITYIGENAFKDCTALKSIVLPNSVTSVGDGAFRGCSNLQDITVPAGLTAIGKSAFWGCAYLRVVYLSDIGAWCGIEFEDDYSNPFTQDCSMYLDGTLVNKVVIPDGVTAIKDRAFYGCASIESFDIPDSVTSIGSRAFYGCTTLESMIIPDSVTSIGSYAFNGCSDLENISISDNILSIGKYAFKGTAYYENVNNWENDILYIDNCLIEVKETFEGDYTVKHDTKCIASYSFLNCSSLTSLTIGDGIAYRMDMYEFHDNTSLKSLVLGNGVNHIDSRVFLYCPSIETLVIGGGVTFVRPSAFEACTSLKRVFIKGVIERWLHDVFYDTTSCNSVYIDSPTVADSLVLGKDDGILRHVKAVMLESSITNVTDQVKKNYTYTETFNCGGKTYNSYSDHAHVWEEYSSAANGCAKNGFTGHECSVCGTIKGDVVSGHTYSDGWSEDGTNHWLVCSLCSYTSDKTEHGYDNGFDAECNTCGIERELNIQQGDINNDGYVDNMDAAAILKYDSGITDIPENARSFADVNGDSFADNLDTVRILKYDAGLIDSL